MRTDQIINIKPQISMQEINSKINYHKSCIDYSYMQVVNEGYFDMVLMEDINGNHKLSISILEIWKRQILDNNTT